MTIETYVRDGKVDLRLKLKRKQNLHSQWSFSWTSFDFNSDKEIMTGGESQE